MAVETQAVTVADTAVEMMRAGRFEALADLFAPPMAAVVSAATVRDGWNGEIAKIGEIREIGTPALEPVDTDRTRVVVPVTGTAGAITVRIVVDTAGRLHGLRLAAPAESDWTPPGYAGRRRFTEQEVTLGSGPQAVPGTLTLPRGGHRHPAVVLVASGPADRDATVGPNRPFQDLAWGLAARGIAVLRFDKIGFTHGGAESADGFTMVDEYVPHAVSAVRLLLARSDIDPYRVFLAGHSGGGKAVPRIAAAEPRVAGIAILAGDTVPLPRAVLRVFDHVAAVTPGQDMGATLAQTTRRAAATVAVTPETPTADLLFGWPASYWLDLRDYDQVATAAALDKPILLVQGGRDYQVTAEDDLPQWESGLEGRATIRVHESLDHMLFAGAGPSAPADYLRPGQHVDAAVIDDLATWIAPEAARGPLRRLFARFAG